MASCSHAQRLGEAALGIDENLRALNISASRALAVPGWAEPLVSALQPCLRPRTSRSKPELLIGVYGGSMTAGSMNCHTTAHILCAGAHKPVHLAWPAVLQRELQPHLPACHVRVTNRATPASRATFLLSAGNMRSLVPTGRSADAVVITDFTVNDNKGLGHLPSREVPAAAMQIAAAMEGLVRFVRGPHPGRSGPPALLQVETTRWLFVDGRSVNLSANWACTPASANVSHGRYDPHYGVARHYGVPVISFLHGAECVRGERTTLSEYQEATRRHWRGGCGELDAGTGESVRDCGVHPGPTTHSILARLIAHHILRHAAAAAAEACGTALPSSLAADAGPPAANSTLVPEAQMRRFQGCGPGVNVGLHGTTIDFQACTSGWQRFVASNTGWSCYEDRPGKPGLIANATGATIEFKVRATATASGGDIVIGFLRSYEGMGRVRVGFNGVYSESDRTTNTLDGLWESRTSQQDLAVISATALAASHLNRTLSGSGHHPSHLRLGLQLLPASQTEQPAAAAAKFKVLSIVTC